MNVKNITDNKKCWKTVGPNLSSKKSINENISLWEKILLITDVKTAANVFNDYFISIIKERNKFDPKHLKLSNNPVLPVVNKCQNHPSSLKNKSNRTYSSFTFRPVN